MAKEAKKAVQSTSAALERIIDDATRDDRSWFEKMFSENMSRKSATTQIFLGATTGWITGFTLVKIGKIAALLIGGSIVLIEVANENGMIKIDWVKVEKGVDKVTDKVEEVVTGNKKNWMDKTERFIDRKLDRADNFIDSRLRPKRWYTGLVGDESGVKFNRLHLFVMGFCGGLAVGVFVA